MAKKTKTKAKKFKKSIIFSTLSLGVIVFVMYAFSTYFLEIYNIYKEKQDLTKEITKLENEEEKLESEVQKLKDPEYVARYAREKYSYSKDGEYIIKLPEDENAD